MAYAVLIVDDSKTVRSMVKKTLQLAGIPVQSLHEAGNGAEALAIMQKQWVDIVFADVHMPEMNGIEMMEHMSQDHILVSVPVVVVSSDQNAGHIRRLEELGIRAYIKKPFRPETFRDVVQEILGEQGDKGT